MSPTMALLACFVFVVALLAMDIQWRPRVPVGGWLPLLWLLIVGSRPVSSWISQSPQFEGSDVYLDGSPIDRLCYLLMILAGLLILRGRRVSWRAVCSDNKWLLLYFGFCVVSVLWSDYPFVSFKRWIKDFGNVLMILIVLSEKEPLQAVKALLVRCSYVLIPFSVVLVKYFPDLARSYNRWTGFAYFTGVSTDKNLLGMVLTCAAVSLCWALSGLRHGTDGRFLKAQALVYGVLLAMTGWLLVKANSATAIACTVLGLVALFLLGFQFIRLNIGRLMAGGLVLGIVLAATGAWTNLQSALAGVLGRDPSLTGRTDIWQAVFNQNTNPLVGVGFYSFWMGERVEKLSASYFYALNEAHNGYLEVYLNNGLIGVALLCMFMFSTMRRAMAELAAGAYDQFAVLRLTFVLVVLVYGFMEAVFSRLSVIWFCLMLVSCTCCQSLSQASLSRATGSVKFPMEKIQGKRVRGPKRRLTSSAANPSLPGSIARQQAARSRKLRRVLEDE